MLAHLLQGYNNFCVKGQRIDRFDFEGHPISVTTTQLCHCNIKAAIDTWKQVCMTSILGIYPKECKSIYKRDICIHMFTVYTVHSSQTVHNSQTVKSAKVPIAKENTTYIIYMPWNIAQ
jgi:hypothetical protein